MQNTESPQPIRTQKVEQKYYQQYDQLEKSGRRQAIQTCMFGLKPSGPRMTPTPLDRVSMYKSYESPYSGGTGQERYIPPANNRGRVYYGRIGQPY